MWRSLENVFELSHKAFLIITIPLGMEPFLFKIEKLVLRARSDLNGFTGKDRELFWSTGALEYWSVVKSESPNLNLNESFHYSTTPSLQQTAARGKDH